MSDTNKTVTTIATWLGLGISLCSLLQVMWTQKPWFVADPPKKEEERREQPRYYELPSEERPARATRSPLPLPVPRPSPLPPAGAGDPSTVSSLPEEFLVMSPAPVVGSSWGKWTLPIGLLLMVGALVWRVRSKKTTKVTP